MQHKISENVFQIFFSNFGSCVYLIKNKNEKILIDTSSSENSSDLKGELFGLGISPDEINYVLITHNHWDHIGNIKMFKNAKIFDSKNISKFKSIEIKVIKTPGHSSDSLCFLYKDILFSGDTIFHNDEIGRTDFPDSSESEIKESIKKLENLNYKILCPGHI